MRSRPPAALLLVLLAATACSSGILGLPTTIGGSDLLPTVAFLSHAAEQSMAPEQAAAWQWLRENDDFDAYHVLLVDLPRTRLPADTVFWWHYGEEAALPSMALRGEVLDAIRQHLRGGGSALLTLVAASYVVALGLEDLPPDTVSTTAARATSGELGGIQSHSGHPLLKPSWGGSFTSATTPAPSGRAVAAYSGDRWPQQGRVWAVHRDETGVDPTLKLGIEYPAAGPAGGVVTLGAHIYFAEADNHNRPQLERLIGDALRYLDRRPVDDPPGVSMTRPGAQPPAEPATSPIDGTVAKVLDGIARYWTPATPAQPLTNVAATSLPPAADARVVINRIEGSRSGIELTSYPDQDVPFTLGSPSAAVSGSQLGRIDEFRVHPRRLLSGLRFGIVRPERGVTWLDEGAGQRTFSARPEGDELHYTDGEIDLTLYLTVDRRYPALVGVLAVRAPSAIDIIATWRPDQGRGEPPVQGRPEAGGGWDDGAQAFVWRDGNGFVAKAGFGVRSSGHMVDPDGLAIQVHLDPGQPALVPFVVVGGSEDAVDVDAAFADLVAAPGQAWNNNANYFRELLDHTTMGLLVPNGEFESAFKWAKAGIEALRTVTPWVGIGPVSGHGGTSEPWLATPNAFGGGALWAAMAADAYGDRGLAVDALRVAARYQGIDGRIAAAIDPAWQRRDNRVVDSALFLVALENHVRTWADLALLRELWPAATATLAYLFETDTDGDTLINAFSSLDRWSDDPVVLTTIDAAAMWGAALEATASMATLLGDDATASRCATAAAAVRQRLNEEFWDPTSRRFRFAKRHDGSLVDAPTVLPSMALMFGLLDAGNAQPTLDAFASSELSTDWGVALLGTPREDAERDAAATPQPAITGLPTVAIDTVNPLFTGWAALAEYANHRGIAGFVHTWANLNLLDHGNLGRSGGSYDRDVFRRRGTIAHAAAAQAMTVLPVIWGMLGIRSDALTDDGIIEIAPHLPAGWDRVEVEPVRVGDDTFRVQILQLPGQVVFNIVRRTGSRDVQFRLSTHVPVDVNVAFDPAVGGAVVTGEPIVEDLPFNRAATATIRLTGQNATARFVHDPYPRVIPPGVMPPAAEPEPGGPSIAARIIQARYLGGILHLELEGLPGRAYRLRLATPWRVRQVTGVPAVAASQDGPGVVMIEFVTPGGGLRYRPVSLEVSFER